LRTLALSTNPGAHLGARAIMATRAAARLEELATMPTRSVNSPVEGLPESGAAGPAPPPALETPGARLRALPPASAERAASAAIATNQELLARGGSGAPAASASGRAIDDGPGPSAWGEYPPASPRRSGDADAPYSNGADVCAPTMPLPSGAGASSAPPGRPPPLSAGRVLELERFLAMAREREGAIRDHVPHLAPGCAPPPPLTQPASQAEAEAPQQQQQQQQLAAAAAAAPRGPPGASALFIVPTPEQFAEMARKRAAALARRAEVRARGEAELAPRELDFGGAARRAPAPPAGPTPAQRARAAASRGEALRRRAARLRLQAIQFYQAYAFLHAAVEARAGGAAAPPPPSPEFEMHARNEAAARAPLVADVRSLFVSTRAQEREAAAAALAFAAPPAPSPPLTPEQAARAAASRAAADERWYERQTAAFLAEAQAAARANLDAADAAHQAARRRY
jgi:hypothetical protein